MTSRDYAILFGLHDDAKQSNLPRMREEARVYGVMVKADPRRWLWLWSHVVDDLVRRMNELRQEIAVQQHFLRAAEAAGVSGPRDRAMFVQVERLKDSLTRASEDFRYAYSVLSLTQNYTIVGYPGRSLIAATTEPKGTDFKVKAGKAKDDGNTKTD